MHSGVKISIYCSQHNKQSLEHWMSERMAEGLCGVGGGGGV